MPIPISIRRLERQLGADIILGRPHGVEIRGILQRDQETASFFIRYPMYNLEDGPRHWVRKGDAVLLHAACRVKGVTGLVRREPEWWRTYRFTG